MYPTRVCVCVCVCVCVNTHTNTHTHTHRDGTCELGPDDFAGFVWVSLKMYVPSRKNCLGPHKGGPPILSPFTKYNYLPIPTPEQLKCTDIFGLRVQVFQAKDLPSENKTGIANAFVQVHFMGKEMSTRTVFGSNSPTWDEALQGSKFNNLELPCLGWPGECGEYPTDVLDYKYNPKDEDWEEKPDTDEYAERWVKNYNMLRLAPRIEVRVIEMVGGTAVMLGRCYIRPEECYHTTCDPVWRELYKGLPEIDMGLIYMSVQLVHQKDPIYKAPPAELIPQRTSTDQMALAIDNEIPGIEAFSRSQWSAEGGFTDTVDGIEVPHAFFNRKTMPCAGISMPPLLAAAEVMMRECKVQVQILGLRNMSKKLKLTSPSLHVFIQTSEQWNADEKSYQFTKDKSLPSPYEVNFQEQIELDVLLPDDAEYAPNLEFVVMDQGDFWSFEGQTVVCWGTCPLKHMYPCGEKPDEGGGDVEEEDAATAARREKAEKKQQFDEIVASLQRRGTLDPKQASKLSDTFKAQQGKGSEIEQAFDFYMAAPSDLAFIQRTEDWLSLSEKAALKGAEKEIARMEKKKEEEKKKKERDEQQKQEQEKKIKKQEEEKKKKQEKKEAKAKEKIQAAADALAAKLLKEEENARKKEEKRTAAEAKKQLEEEVKAKIKAAKSGSISSPAPAAGPGAVDAEDTPGVVVKREEAAHVSDGDEAYDSADAPGDKYDTDGEGGSDVEPTRGDGPDEAKSVAGEMDAEEAECPGSDDEDGVRDGVAPTEEDMLNGDADKGPDERFREEGDDPRFVGQAKPTSEQNADAPGDAMGAYAGAGNEDGPQNKQDGENYLAIRPEDDEEPDRQEMVDTADGKPTAEWLVLRRFPSFMEPLEKTEEWGPYFEPSFDEIGLYKGRIKDYKRREAEQVGIVKCKIKIFRKEDETLAGRAKADTTRTPDYYEVGPEDPSISDALENMRPYRMYNIYELYPESTVEIRAYCLKAFQVTPGGFMREESEELIFFHYLQAELGNEVASSNVVKALNPNFFFVFQFKQCILPGPSQLTIKLMDGVLGGLGNSVQDCMCIGQTVIDLEDRWFCQFWRDVRYKPREVRDLVNEETLPGVSQGKLSLFIDIVDQNKADDNPIEDIQVLGKTLTMEVRVIIWNTRDTAPKDSYTSDVYVMCELIGCGQPKMTDTHPSVKIKAYGMFNYRLKWRCKYPDMNLEYLMRIGVWDENSLTSHQAIGEGVLPLRKLFKDCFERNQGKTSPDEMEYVFLTPQDIGENADVEKQVYLDDDNNKYPYVNFNLVHPNFGFNVAKDAQAKLEITVQVMPRAKAKAGPAGKARYGPSKLPEPGRPPQPANPIFEPEKCKAYINYTISETFNSCRTPCICLCCILCVG